MRQSLFALLSLFLLCGASPADLPEALYDYVEDGVFSPRDFEWMRSAFPEATDEEKASYNAISVWREECHNEEKERVRAELATRGFPNVELKDIPTTTDYCAQFAVEGRNRHFASFDEFSARLASTRPIFDAYLAATDLATRLARLPTRDLATDLHHRTIAEQVTRHALSWTRITEQRARIPMFTDEQSPVFEMLLSAEMSRLDRANTAWLKLIVAEHGWSTYSLVGEDASRKAWLLVQHADHDPVFQLDILRLMEPLVEAGEVNQRDYAYLYDRVMLK